MTATTNSSQQSPTGRLASVRDRLTQTRTRLGAIPAWFRTAQMELNARNARFLEVEIFWASFLSAAATFNAAFAVRLGASNQEIGWLTSMPALLAFLVTIPAGRYFSRQRHWMSPIVRSLFVYRFGFLVIALLPWFPLPAKESLLIWTLILFTIPAHFFSVGWNSMMADAIPEINRAKVFALRNSIAAIALTGGIFAAGLWLEYAPFPFNYQAMYFVGFLASMISLYYIAKIRLPERKEVAPVEVPQDRLTLRQKWARVFGADGLFRRQPDFTRIVINTFLHGVGLWMVGPLYVLYYVRGLGAAEGWLGLNGMLANLTPIVGYFVWQRATVRWGENRVLKLSITAIGLYPLLVGASPNLTLILVWTGLYGVLAPGVALTHFPMLLKICPEGERPFYMGVFTTLMNLGAFIMPMIGVVLADIYGLQPVLIAGGVITLIGSASFVFWPLQTADSLSIRREKYT
ncbi:MAG: MFS transporter [Caldilineaceae bacterium]|nr:MFS transporter [Caldilineaceae bacterium]